MADENLFEPEQDEEGYPPGKWETLWARPEKQKGQYRIDNIPFYVRGISSGDVVAAEYNDNQLQFACLVSPSPNSVFRLYFAEETDMQSTRDAFRGLNCESELSNIPKLVAIEAQGNSAPHPTPPPETPPPNPPHSTSPWPRAGLPLPIPTTKTHRRGPHRKCIASLRSPAKPDSAPRKAVLPAGGRPFQFSSSNLPQAWVGLSFREGRGRMGQPIWLGWPGAGWGNWEG